MRTPHQVAFFDVVLIVCVSFFLGAAVDRYVIARPFHKNTDYASYQAATYETVEFINANLRSIRKFEDRYQLLAYSLSMVPQDSDGLYCEFGVESGTSINFIASRTNHIIHGFDSFEGLPEDWRPGFSAGTFKLEELPKVRANVELHKGWFDQSIAPFKAKFGEPVVFLHMDADLYSSTKTTLDLLADRIIPGTVIQFDEFFNYPGWKQGEYKAFMEFVSDYNVSFEYIGFTGGTGEQVAVRILSVARNS